MYVYVYIYKYNPPTWSACRVLSTIRFERCESEAIRKRNDSKATLRNSETKRSGERTDVIRKRSDSKPKRSESEDFSLSNSNSLR